MLLDPENQSDFFQKMVNESANLFKSFQAQSTVSKPISEQAQIILHNQGSSFENMPWLLQYNSSEVIVHLICLLEPNIIEQHRFSPLSKYMHTLSPDNNLTDNLFELLIKNIHTSMFQLRAFVEFNLLNRQNAISLILRQVKALISIFGEKAALRQVENRTLFEWAETLNIEEISLWLKQNLTHDLSSLELSSHDPSSKKRSREDEADQATLKEPDQKKQQLSDLFEPVPTEMTEKILSFLSAKDLSNCREVSKQFNKAAENFAWMPFFQNYFLNSATGNWRKAFISKFESEVVSYELDSKSKRLLYLMRSGTYDQIKSFYTTETIVKIIFEYEDMDDFRKLIINMNSKTLNRLVLFFGRADRRSASNSEYQAILDDIYNYLVTTPSIVSHMIEKDSRQIKAGFATLCNKSVEVIGPSQATIPAYYLFTPLIVAASLDNITLVKKLVDVGYPINSRISSGHGVAYFAAHYNYTDLLEFFVHKQLDLTGDIRMSLYHRETHIAERLLDYIPGVLSKLHSANRLIPPMGWQALVSCCVLQNSPGLVENLLKLSLRGLKANSKYNALEGGCDVYWLHKAAAQGFEQMVEILLRFGALVNQLDPSSKTPAIYAALNGHLSVIKILKKNNASLFLRTDYLKNLWMTDEPKLETIHYLLTIAKDERQKIQPDDLNNLLQKIMQMILEMPSHLKSNINHLASEAGGLDPSNSRFNLCKEIVELIYELCPKLRQFELPHPDMDQSQGLSI